MSKDEALKEIVAANSDGRPANLRNANLRDASLWDANLRNANLRDADLWDADLWDANLRHANLEGAKGLHTFSIVPDEGPFTAWKKIGGCLIKLAVPSAAERVNAYGRRKCRVSSAKVLSIVDIESGEKRKNTHGGYDHYFVYTVGTIAVPDGFNGDKRVECTNGIHCFITKQEALEW